MTKKLTIALLSGGISSEREVSLNSGRQVYEALDKAKYDVLRYDPKTDLPRLVADAPRIDAALIILHGAYGEDGTVQGLLDLLGIPYQGSGVLGSAVAMNKLAAKRLYQQAGLPIPDYVVARRGSRVDPEDAVQRLGLPLVVKPVVGGSSVGITIVRSPQELDSALEAAYVHDPFVLIETYIQGTEITGGVIGNDELEALPIIEIIPDRTTSFSTMRPNTRPASTQEICPARIDAELTAKGPAPGDGGAPGALLPRLQPDRHDAAGTRDLHPRNQHDPGHDGHQPAPASGADRGDGLRPAAGPVDRAQPRGPAGPQVRP